MGGFPRRGLPWLLVATVVGVVLSLLPWGPALAIASSTAGLTSPAANDSTSRQVEPLAVADFSTPFASRAGFSPSYAGEVSDAQTATGSTVVVVTFEPRNAPAFFSAPSPGAAPMNPTGIGARFGLSPTQYSEVERYFEAEGLSVVRAWPDRLSLTLEGPASAAGAAFGTTIRSGLYSGSPVTYPATPPELPASIEPLVGSVLGLSSGFDSFTIPFDTSLSRAVSEPSQSGSNEVTPAIAREIYDLSGLYNVSGSFHPALSKGIALLLWGYGYAPSDLNTFFSQDYPSSFPAPTIDAYPVDGAPLPGPGAVSDPCKASQELTLDLEWAGSMAPGATLDAVYAPEGTGGGPNGCSPSDASMADALHEAVTLPVEAVSMSFGTPESDSSGLAASWQVYMSEALQEGITLLAATGDLGGDASANCQGGAAPEYPSTSPDVLAVGGTDVSLNYGVLGGLNGFSETAWSGSGGGYSSQYPAPQWQPGFSGRGEPDVAASAALNYFYYNGQALQGAGTSFATPLWAGLIAEMDAIHGSPFGLIAPRLYSIGNAEAASGSRTPTGLAGITSGSNCVASAGPGWNAVTGWGSPRGLNLYEDLTATFVNLTVSATPTTVSQGATVTISGHLANATNGAPIANVPVSVSLASTVNVGPCTGVFGSATALTNALGDLSLSVVVPACYLGSHALAQVLVTSDGYYGTNSTEIAINLLGLAPALGFLAEFPTNVVFFVAITVLASVLGYLLGRGPPVRPSTSESPSAGPGAGSPPVPPPEPPSTGNPGGGESQSK